MKVLGKETLWEGKFISAVRLTYRDHRGEEQHWEAVERQGCDGIVILVPVTPDGRVVLIRQFRPVLGRPVIELPAGLVEEGEEPLDAARRELIEETGYMADALQTLSRGVMSTGINTEIWHAVLAPGVTEATAEVREAHPPDATEDIEVFTAPMDGIYEYLRAREEDGDYVDIRIYGLVELARRALDRPEEEA